MTPGWFAGLVVALASAGLGVWFELSLWLECRGAGHGVLYCMRVLGW